MYINWIEGLSSVCWDIDSDGHKHRVLCSVVLVLCRLHFLVYNSFPSKVTDITQNIQRENYQETREH